MANKGFSIGRNLPIMSNSFGTDDTVSFNICKEKYQTTFKRTRYII